MAEGEFDVIFTKSKNTERQNTGVRFSALLMCWKIGLAEGQFHVICMTVKKGIDKTVHTEDFTL